MNKSFKKIAALLLTVIVLVSCNSKKDDNASLITTRYLSADITEVKKPFNQTNKDDSFINNNFFLFVEMKCDEEMGDRLNYLNYYYDRKVNVLKYFNELHEDINYITAYSITNWITLGEYRHNRDELGEVYEIYCKALVDYLSQFTTFLIYVSNPNKYREYYAHTYIGSDVGENYELHEEEYFVLMDDLSFIPVKDGKLMLNSLIEFCNEWLLYPGDNIFFQDKNGRYIYPFVKRYELLFEDGMDVVTEFPNKLEEYYNNYDKYVEQIKNK